MKLRIIPGGCSFKMAVGKSWMPLKVSTVFAIGLTNTSTTDLVVSVLVLSLSAGKLSLDLTEVWLALVTSKVSFEFTARGSSADAVLWK